MALVGCMYLQDRHNNCLLYSMKFIDKSSKNFLKLKGQLHRKVFGWFIWYRVNDRINSSYIKSVGFLNEFDEKNGN